ncbi:hypothetical protein [Cellulomonas sp. C5510]|uniref:hypothetical protein n=1 Tax=Cellulomonas sp. C5510 TaxID=2871170 RepID=UPI001C9650AF|nr:hypothetical protein [Cellulomonas sp. C5510]QZN85787.1 hypothetical protein K5O09_00695 [Cellulomonas sp. C5510]
MISARTFARQSAVWSDVTPLLENFVRWANLNEGAYAKRVPGPSSGRLAAVISELGFEYSCLHTGRTAHADPLGFVVQAMNQLPGGRQLRRPHLSVAQEAEARALARNIDAFCVDKNVQFRPIIPGCGVVDVASADLVVNDTLIEVKSVTRGFRSSDFRQILTYLAMKHASGDFLPRVTVLNPRSGVHCSVTTEFLAQNAAGASAIELLDAVVGWMSEMQVSA